MHEEGQVLKMRLKYKRRLAKKINHAITSKPQSYGDLIFQLNKITSIEKIEFLKSISVRVDYENDNTIIAKREFLFPASYIEGDKKFPDNFIEPYNYKFPVNSFDEKKFFEGMCYFESSKESENKKRKTEFLKIIKDQPDNIIIVNKNDVF